MVAFRTTAIFRWLIVTGTAESLQYLLSIRIHCPEITNHPPQPRTPPSPLAPKSRRPPRADRRADRRHRQPQCARRGSTSVFSAQNALKPTAPGPGPAAGNPAAGKGGKGGPRRSHPARAAPSRSRYPRPAPAHPSPRRGRPILRAMPAFKRQVRGSQPDAAPADRR